MLVPDRVMTSRGFGSLDSAQVARLDAVVARARASWQEAESLASPPWWDPFRYVRAGLIGADSSVAGLKANAAAAKNLYETLLAKRNRLANDPGADEYEVREMEGAVYATSNEAASDTAYQLSPTAFYDQVVKKTFTDAGDKINNPFGVPLGLWVAGALALWIVAKARR